MGYFFKYLLVFRFCFIYDSYKCKEATINDNFEEDVIKIVIKHQCSIPNQIWTAEDLGLNKELAEAKEDCSE